VIENNGLATPASKARIRFHSPASGPNGLHFEMTSNTFSSVSTSMFMADNGNVGVGTTAPVAKMHVAGKLAIGTYTSSTFGGEGLSINTANNGAILIERNSDPVNWDPIKARIDISTYTGKKGLRFIMTQNSFATHVPEVNEALFLSGDGMVGMGNTNPQSKLHVTGDFCVSNTGGAINFKVYPDGHVRAREILIDLNNIPDYVFKSGYKLMTIQEVEKFISEHGHLPNIPSEEEYRQKGAMAIGELETKLLEKVEELTLYITQLHHRIEKLEKEGTNKN
jgi:hypothetical protein